MIGNGSLAAVDVYDAWAFAAVESALALEEWLSAQHAEKELAYGAYVASLDREEKAATVLAECMGHAAATPLGATA